MTETHTTRVRPEKVEAVEQIKRDLGETQAVVLTEYRGLTVTELAELRSGLRAQETSYRVVKNTLARRAVSESGLEELAEYFVGPVAVAYVKGDPVAAAKVLATFAREHPALVITGGVLDGRVLSADETKGLATVDSLDVSRAKIAGLLTAALRQIAMLAEAPARQILYVLEQVGSRAPQEAAAVDATEQVSEEEGPASTAEAEPEPEPETEEGPASTAEADPEPEPAAVDATEHVSEEKGPASTAEAEPEPETKEGE